MWKRARPVPFRLDEGIALKDGALLIRWGTPIAKLAQFESPTITQRLHSIHLCWPNRRCLDGLPCDVRATRICESPNPRAYHIYLPEFHWASMDVQVEWGETDSEVEWGFRRLYEHLERKLGPPSFSYPEYERGLPAIFWEWPRLLVGYSLMGGRAEVSVAHKPDGYAALRAKAWVIWACEGDGARVNYVAWRTEQGGVEPSAAPDRPRK